MAANVSRVLRKDISSYNEVIVWWWCFHIISLSYPPLLDRHCCYYWYWSWYVSFLRLRLTCDLTWPLYMLCMSLLLLCSVLSLSLSLSLSLFCSITESIFIPFFFSANVDPHLGRGTEGERVEASSWRCISSTTIQTNTTRSDDSALDWTMLFVRKLHMCVFHEDNVK